MIPMNRAPMIDGHGKDLDDDADAGNLAALLRLSPDDTVDEARIITVIAATRLAAYQTRQQPQPRTTQVRAWLARLKMPGDDGLWRFGVPAAVALVLGVLVGHASVDPVGTTANTASNVESLIASPRSMEFFGL